MTVTPDDALLRHIARENSQEMNERIDRHRAMDHDGVDRRLEAIEERLAEHDRLLGIEHAELPSITHDGLASGDNGVTWDDFDFDQSVHPQIARPMIDRNGYGRS